MVIFIVTEKGRISCLTRTCTTNSATTSSPRSEGCKKERWKFGFWHITSSFDVASQSYEYRRNLYEYRFDRIYIYQFHVDTNQLESIEKIYKEALHL